MCFSKLYSLILLRLKGEIFARRLMVTGYLRISKDFRLTVSYALMSRSRCLGAICKLTERETGGKSYQCVPRLLIDTHQCCADDIEPTIRNISNNIKTKVVLYKSKNYYRVPTENLFPLSVLFCTFSVQISVLFL